MNAKHLTQPNRHPSSTGPCAAASTSDLNIRAGQTSFAQNKSERFVSLQIYRSDIIGAIIQFQVRLATTFQFNIEAKRSSSIRAPEPYFQHQIVCITRPKCLRTWIFLTCEWQCVNHAPIDKGTSTTVNSAFKNPISKGAL